MNMVPGLASACLRGCGLRQFVLERVVLDREPPAVRCKPYVSAIFTAAIQSRLGIRARALCVLRHCSNRRRTPSSGAGRSRLFLTFIGRPPQNREPTTNDTTSLKTIHARSPKRHERARTLWKANSVWPKPCLLRRCNAGRRFFELPRFSGMMRMHTIVAIVCNRCIRRPAIYDSTIPKKLAQKRGNISVQSRRVLQKNRPGQS